MLNVDPMLAERAMMGDLGVAPVVAAAAAPIVAGTVRGAAKGLVSLFQKKKAPPPLTWWQKLKVKLGLKP
jgi:hypothetical protein